MDYSTASFQGQGQGCTKLFDTSLPLYLGDAVTALMSQSLWAAITEVLQVLNNRDLSLTVLEAAEFKTKVTADWVFGKGHILVHRLPFFLCVLTRQE